MKTPERMPQFNFDAPPPERAPEAKKQNTETAGSLDTKDLILYNDVPREIISKGAGSGGIRFLLRTEDGKGEWTHYYDHGAEVPVP